MENVLLGRRYDDVVRFSLSKNPQKMFDRQLELCRVFQRVEATERRIITYKVTNKSMTLWVNFDKESDWDLSKYRNLLQYFLQRFKLHLIGYDLWERKKKMVEYRFPLSSEKFVLRVFQYDVHYLNYDSINFN